MIGRLMHGPQPDNRVSEITRTAQCGALRRCAEALRVAAKAAQEGGAPALALRARHDAQEADHRVHQIEQGLIP